MTAERILVVDDDEALLNLMALALKRRGYQVEQAGDGFSALKLVASQPPFSVLLTDLMMPGMTGVELLREARRLDEHIEAVVITAAQDLDPAISALRADGAYDYLLKPFDSMSQLLVSVERAANHRHLLIEREQLRIKVHSEANRLRALIANTGDAILSADSKGFLCIVNPAAARLVGTGNLEGQIAVDCLPPALSTLIINWQAVGGNLPAVVEMSWPDNSIQMVSLAPIPEEEPQCWGWVAVLRDITHVKRMEEIKSQLLVEVAGRIRIPLAQAMNALVELNMLTAQNDRVSAVISRLTHIWKRIQEWGDDLNALLRIDSELNLQTVSINLETILHEMEQSHRNSPDSLSSINLEMEIEPCLPQVLADPELIRRLLNGLINRGLSRSQPVGTVRLHTYSKNGQVWVNISDSGPALDDADLPKIFEKSFAHTGNGSGITGLEMALVKAIIDRMGGQVWLGGQGNQGSNIFICLPTSESVDKKSDHKGLNF